MPDVSEYNLFDFYVDPLCQGRVTPRALLSTTGTISVPLIRELLVRRDRALIARLAGKNWFFNIGYHNGKFVVQRNGGHIAIDEEWCANYQLPDSMLVSWQPDSLILSFGDHFTHWNYPQLVQQSSLVSPPAQLVRWVRGRELSPIETFSSEEQFLIRVHSALQRFDERLCPVLNRDFFWDVKRSGNRIIERRPKREVEIQSVLHAMLVDQMQLSNIDILPEVRSAAGIVDFLFQTGLKSGGIAKICVEFKNAHSEDVTGHFKMHHLRPLQSAPLGDVG